MIIQTICFMSGSRSASAAIQRPLSNLVQAVQLSRYLRIPIAEPIRETLTTLTTLCTGVSGKD